MSFLSENLRPFRRSRAETPCEWLVEPLRSRPEFSVRRTFGCWSFYLGEKNVLLYVPAGDEDGEGILIPTSPEFHASLIAEFPGLAPHDFLKKWLCLGANADDYEETAAAIVRLILRGDPRVGVPVPSAPAEEKNAVPAAEKKRRGVPARQSRSGAKFLQRSDVSRSAAKASAKRAPMTSCAFPS